MSVNFLYGSTWAPGSCRLQWWWPSWLSFSTVEISRVLEGSTLQLLPFPIGTGCSVISFEIVGPILIRGSAYYFHTLAFNFCVLNPNSKHIILFSFGESLESYASRIPNGHTFISLWKTVTTTVSICVHQRNSFVCISLDTGDMALKNHREKKIQSKLTIWNHRSVFLQNLNVNNKYKIQKANCKKMEGNYSCFPRQKARPQKENLQKK